MKSHELSIAAFLLVTFAASTTYGQLLTPWVVTPTPSQSTRSALADVSAISPNDAWAVGFRDTTFLGNSVTNTLAFHWDGAAWSQVPTPSPLPTPLSQTTNVELNTVSMVSSNDVWAAGHALTQVGGGGVFGQWVHFQHWDGASWSVVPALPPVSTTAASGTFVFDSVAFAANDVWFGGAWLESGPGGTIVRRPLAAHWNGTTITAVQTPVIQNTAAPNGFAIVSFSALAPNDIWAVCREQGATGASTLTVILHWDGNSWTQSSVPSTTLLHRMRSIVAVAPGNVWAFGHGISLPFTPRVLHYNGTSWSSVASAPRAGSGIATDTMEMILGVDSTLAQFNGSTSTTIETFPGLTSPNITAFAKAPDGTLFAVGTHFTTASPPTRPLAAIYVPPGPMASVTTRIPCLGITPPQSLVASAPPILGQAFTVISGDPTGVAQLTPGATLSYLIYSVPPILPGGCGPFVGGMGIGSTPGELLVDLGSGLLGISGPVPWTGLQNGAFHSTSVPSFTGLAGFAIRAQAALIDLIGPSSPGVLTEALDLVLGY